MKLETDFIRIVKPSDAPATGWTTLPAQAFHRALHRVLPVASKDRERQHVNCVLIESDGTTLRMVATDGHRLSVARETVQTDPFEMVLPRDAARVIEALANNPTLEAITVAVDEQTAYFGISGNTFAAPLAKGTIGFPPWQQIMPKAYGASAVCARHPMRQALLLATRVDERGYRTCHTSIDVARGSATVRLANVGQLPFAFECGPTTGEVHICSATRYLITALRTIGGERVRVATNGPLDPIVLTPADDVPGGESLTAIVMPVRP